MVVKFLSRAFVCAAVLLTGLSEVSAHPSIDIVATNWKFTPAVIEGHVGQETTLHLSSSEGVHGIVSDELGIHKTILFPDKVVEVWSISWKLWE